MAHLSALCRRKLHTARNRDRRPGEAHSRRGLGYGIIGTDGAFSPAHDEQGRILATRRQEVGPASDERRRSIIDLLREHAFALEG